MSLISNERTKLLASALNAAATSCFTVGVLAPVAAAFYDIGGRPVPLGTLLSGRGIWFRAAVVAHLSEAGPSEFARMTDIQLFAFVVLPVVVAALGPGAALLHDPAAKAERRREEIR